MTEKEYCMNIFLIVKKMHNVKYLKLIYDYAMILFLQ